MHRVFAQGTVAFVLTPQQPAHVLCFRQHTHRSHSERHSQLQNVSQSKDLFTPRRRACLVAPCCCCKERLIMPLSDVVCLVGCPSVHPNFQFQNKFSHFLDVSCHPECSNKICSPIFFNELWVKQGATQCNEAFWFTKSPFKQIWKTGGQDFCLTCVRILLLACLLSRGENNIHESCPI